MDAHAKALLQASAALESIKHDSEFFSVSHLRSLAKIALEQTK
jgi:hypothetical protein